MSGLRLRAEFAAFDAEKVFGLGGTAAPTSRAECISALVLQGLKKPSDCPAFGMRCTPENPLGAPMVSSEGACAAYYRYRRHMVAGVMNDCCTLSGAAARQGHDPARPRQRRNAQRRAAARHLSAGVLKPDSGPPGRPGHGQRQRRPAGRSPPIRSWSSRCFSAGGDIGSLAVHGTVNDLAMGGAHAAVPQRRVHPGRGPVRWRRCGAWSTSLARGRRGGRRRDRHRRHEGGREGQRRRAVHQYHRDRLGAGRRVLCRPIGPGRAIASS